MPRRLKPLEVSDEQFKDGSRFKVFYDRNDDEFFADVLGERVAGSTEAKCKARASERWREHSKIEWGKILVVRVFDRFGREGDSVHFAFEVSDVGREATSGAWMERNEESGRVHMYHGEKETDAEGGIYVLPWSPELEAACEEIARRFVDLRRRLGDALGRPDVVARLGEWAGKLLPPGD